MRENAAITIFVISVAMTTDDLETPGGVSREAINGCSPNCNARSEQYKTAKNRLSSVLKKEMIDISFFLVWIAL